MIGRIRRQGSACGFLPAKNKGGDEFTWNRRERGYYRIYGDDEPEL